MKRESKIRGVYLISGIIAGAYLLGLCLEWSGTGEPKIKKSQNELNAEANAFCIQSHMKPVLEDGKVICSPDQGRKTIEDFWDTQLGNRIIREKLRQEGYHPNGQVKWPEDEPAPIKSYKKPVNNSFEAKVKVTE